jgi:hypothetical protein
MLQRALRHASKRKKIKIKREERERERKKVTDTCKMEGVEQEKVIIIIIKFN